MISGTCETPGDVEKGLVSTSGHASKVSGVYDLTLFSGVCIRFSRPCCCPDWGAALAPLPPLTPYGAPPLPCAESGNLPSRFLLLLLLLLAAMLASIFRSQR